MDDDSDAEQNNVVSFGRLSRRKSVISQLFCLIVHLIAHAHVTVGQDEKFGCLVERGIRVKVIIGGLDFRVDFVDVINHREDEFIGLENICLAGLTDDDPHFICVAVLGD